ncbi:MAG: hypothetical protein LBF22_02160, partial [Deltaproteobacteria bacterium]|nr:hypothetical protein [Deltaproteobacteria bacterium]
MSLVIAFILWLSLSGKDMTTKVLPVTLAYLNANSERLYVDHENLIRAVNLTVEANAAQFRIIESRKLTLNIDLSTLTPGENTFHIDPTTMLD